MNHGEHGHSAVVKRLKRASGHLSSTIAMIEGDRECVDVLQQLSAVISALNNTRILLLQDHMHKCLKPALKNGYKDLVIELESVLSRAMKV